MAVASHFTACAGDTFVQHVTSFGVHPALEEVCLLATADKLAEVAKSLKRTELHSRHVATKWKLASV
jgi:hypothetical protein